jgi:hypothetical protein
MVVSPDAALVEHVGGEFFDLSEEGVDEESCGLAGPGGGVVGPAVDGGGVLRSGSVEGFHLYSGEEFGEFGELLTRVAYAPVALGGASPGGGDVVFGAGFGEEGFAAAPSVVAGARAGLCDGVVHVRLLVWCGKRVLLGLMMSHRVDNGSE